MTINGFVLINEDKIQRAINGLTYEGKKIGGLPEGYTPEQLLAEYDRLGGYITQNGVKVRTGSFYDFINKRPYDKPVVKFMTNIEGEEVEVTEEEAKSIKKAKDKMQEIKAKKVKKLKKLAE